MIKKNKMAAVVFETPVAYSETGKYFCYCGNDGKLKIWDTFTGILKQEYTKNLHLSSPCTSLVWLQTSKAKSTKKRKLQDSNSDFHDVIAIGTTNGSVMLYNVEGNCLLTEIAGHTDRINGLTSTKSNFFSCSDDKHVIQWDLSNHKIKSKWKVGKERIKSVLALSCDDKILTASCSIKLWDIEKKQVLKTFVGHASDVFMLLEVTGNDSYFMSAAKGDRMISAWSLLGNEQQAPAVASFLLQDNAAFVHLKGVVESSTLCAVTESGVLHIFAHKLNGGVKKPIKPKMSFSIASENDTGKGTSSPLPIHAALCLQGGNILIAYGNPAFLSFETLILSEYKETNVVLIRQIKRRTGADEFNNKTRVPDISGDVEYVKAGSVTNQKKNGPIEQRLENLELVGADAPRKDNMAHLLVQGLQSKDRHLIQDVLFREEDAIITSTVRHLPIQALNPLLRELINLLHGKTFTSRVALKWLNAVVRTHAAILLANPTLKSLLAPLASTIEAKMECLPTLLRLGGRLSLVAEQMTGEPVDDALDEPLVTYQEGEESSESEPASESDVAEEWDEFSDMDDDEPE